MIGSRSWNFNSQPHKEADIRPMFLVYLPTVFQLTASQGGWLLYELIFCPMSCISTHSLTRRLTRNQSIVSRLRCISTHSLTRRLTRNQSIVSRLRCISTHSLTRRLTHDFPTADLFFSFQLTASQGGWQRCGILPHPHGRISTHSLTRRLTLIIWVRVCIIWHFNSQPHKEADVAWNQWSDINNISTHSLTRRLTLPPSVSPQRSTNFNSQPHKEADSVVNLLFIISAYFNSQPHKEADDWKRIFRQRTYISTHSLTRRLTTLSCLGTFIRYFNSQPHKEADILCTDFSAVNRISTHSLTRRLTVKSVYVSFGVVISTHSLTRRLTYSRPMYTRNGWYFNSQPHKEADLVKLHLCRTPQYFNSQPHKEADDRWKRW